MLLHGWGMHGGIWGGVRGELAQRFRVHVPDLPGYGGSPTAEPYTLTGLAERLVPVLPPRVHLCGWSLGGLVALRLAQLVPERVGRLALISATPRFAAGADWPHGVGEAVLRGFAGELESDYAATLLRFLSLQARGGEAARAVMKNLRSCLFERGAPSPEVLQAGLRILLESDLRAQLPAVGQPVLVVQGDRDALVPPGAALWLAQNLPQARLALIPGCSHAPFLSHRQVFLQALTDFLA